MQPSGSTIVYGKDGWRGTFVSPSPSALPDTSQVAVQLDRGGQLLVAAEALVEQPGGSYYLPLSLAELESHAQGHCADVDKATSMPVIVEALDVQKRVVEAGKVRLTKVVHVRETVVDEPLFRDEVDVERVMIDRVVDGPVLARYEGDTMIIPIMEEVLVVEKRLVLKEELHIRKRRTEMRRPQQITLRREEARVERLETPE